MGTYKELQDRVALDHLNRVDLMPEVRRAIHASIRNFEQQRFWFNQTSTSMAVTNGAAVFAAPTRFLALNRLEITYVGAQQPLRERPLNEILDMNTVASTGIPTNFAYYGEGFMLGVIPDSAYTATVYYLHALPELSADADTNAWTTEAQNLIAHAATVQLLSSIIDDPDEKRLARHNAQVGEAYNALQKRNDMRFSTKLRATKF